MAWTEITCRAYAELLTPEWRQGRLVLARNDFDADAGATTTQWDTRDGQPFVASYLRSRLAETSHFYRWN